MSEHIVVGAESGVPVVQRGDMSNRHGLIAGATGTGKTVSLQVMAEGFSRLGVPVFAVDVKGDLSGIAAPASPHPEVDRRLSLIPLPGYTAQGCPTLFWDVRGETGHPVRVTVSEFGPLILGNLLELNDVQTGILYAGFDIADDQGMLLLDLKDLRSLLAWMGANAKDLRSEYGNISSASIGAIQRRLLVLEEQGADVFFGEPALALGDLMLKDFSGRGVVGLLDATYLIQRAPRVYAAFLLWLLSELFEELPEVGDDEKPRLVLFFDEAHLLFERAPRPLLDKIEQVVRLIRSKGVGVYFITQNPKDIPEDVLGQLGLKIQHALRAFTPKEKKRINAVADGFREKPGLDVRAVLGELATGEALVSALDADGAPLAVARTLVRPPESRIGPLSSDERTTFRSRSPLGAKYEQTLDRRSAYEVLAERAKQAADEDKKERAVPTPVRRRSSRQSVGEAFLKSAARAVGSSLGRRLMRGILGSLLK